MVTNSELNKLKKLKAERDKLLNLANKLKAKDMQEKRIRSEKMKIKDEILKLKIKTSKTVRAAKAAKRIYKDPETRKKFRFAKKQTKMESVYAQS